MEVMYSTECQDIYFEFIIERIKIKIYLCLLKNVYINFFLFYYFFLQLSILISFGLRVIINSNLLIIEVVWKKSYLRKFFNGDCEWYIYYGFIQMFITVSKRINIKDVSLVLYFIVIRIIRIVFNIFCKMQIKENLNLMRVANMKLRRIRLVSCR